MDDWVFALSDSELTLLLMEMRKGQRRIESEIKRIEEELQKRNEYAKLMDRNIKRGTND